MRLAIAAVNGDAIHGFKDDACAGRSHVVDAAQIVAASIIVVPQIEMIETQAGDHLDLPRKLYLILHVHSGEIGFNVVVSIGRALPEGDREADYGLRIRDED